MDANRRIIMKKTGLKYKVFAIVLTVAFTFQSLHSINSHAYTTGFDNLHSACPPLVQCCFGSPINHIAYVCGKAYDCKEYYQKK